jgi:hypothetical protein
MTGSIDATDVLQGLVNMLEPHAENGVTLSAGETRFLLMGIGAAKAAMWREREAVDEANLLLHQQIDAELGERQGSLHAQLDGVP